MLILLLLSFLISSSMCFAMQRMPLYARHVARLGKQCKLARHFSELRYNRETGKGLEEEIERVGIKLDTLRKQRERFKWKAGRTSFGCGIMFGLCSISEIIVCSGIDFLKPMLAFGATSAGTALIAIFQTKRQIKQQNEIEDLESQQTHLSCEAYRLKQEVWKYHLNPFR